MKNSFNLAMFAILFIALSSCSSTQNTSSPKKRSSGPDYSYLNNLADILRKQPGIFVQGSGSSVTVSIRGINSIQLDTRPLYVIDNVTIGRDYSTANSSVLPANVLRVRVLRSMSETNRYGEQGRNGVILITTKGAQKVKSANKK